MTPDDVPPGPIVVDTDVVSWVAWRRGRYLEFESFLTNRVVALSFATVGELYMGAERAGWGTERRAALDLVIRRRVKFSFARVDPAERRCRHRCDASPHR